MTATVSTPDHGRLRHDVEQLVAFDRRTVSPGERDSACYLARRLRDIGAEDIELPTFRTQTSWAPAHLDSRRSAPSRYLAA